MSFYFEASTEHFTRRDCGVDNYADLVSVLFLKKFQCIKVDEVCITSSTLILILYDYRPRILM